MVFVDNKSMVVNLLGLCLLPHLGTTYSAKLLSACLGEDITDADLLKVGERVLNLQAAYDARQGVSRKDLDWPKRFYTEGISGGPAAGAVLSRKMLQQTLDEYYGLRGWDKKTGIPTRDKLEELGLEDIAVDLERRGLIKTSRGAEKSSS